MNAFIAQDTISYLTTGEALRTARRDRELERRNRHGMRNTILQLPAQIRERTL